MSAPDQSQTPDAREARALVPPMPSDTRTLVRDDRVRVAVREALDVDIPDPALLRDKVLGVIEQFAPSSSSLPDSGERERVRRALADRLYNGRTISTTFEEAEGFADELLALLDTYRPSSDGGEREALLQRAVDASKLCVEQYARALAGHGPKLGEATSAYWAAVKDLEYCYAAASSSPPAGGEAEAIVRDAAMLPGADETVDDPRLLTALILRFRREGWVRGAEGMALAALNESAAYVKQVREREAATRPAGGEGDDERARRYKIHVCPRCGPDEIESGTAGKRCGECLEWIEPVRLAVAPVSSVEEGRPFGLLDHLVREREENFIDGPGMGREGRDAPAREVGVRWSAIGWYDDEGLGRARADSLQMDDDPEPASFEEAAALVERERTAAPSGDPHDHYAVLRETVTEFAVPAHEDGGDGDAR